MKNLSVEQQDELISKLKARFEKNMNRHPKLNWPEIQQKLEQNPQKLSSLYEMERTGGEPDVISYNQSSKEFIFFDCSPESPAGRRSVCYDKEALDSRKEHKPQNSAIELASQMGIDLLDEEQYRVLQKTGVYDSKTSSWIETPSEIRKLGGALFGDHRYGHVFIYHNGAQSYYAARGFRGTLKV